MLQKLKEKIREWKYRTLAFFIATVGKGIMQALLFTCKWKVEGLEKFEELAKKEKCILMLWHNRLAITPFILYKFAPQFIYAALVSNSQDGRLISAVIHSYKGGRTIRVPHNARYQALKELVRYVKEKKEIVVITPDGPRGPRYKVKPGIAVAAIETGACVIPLDWQANHYWELKTWDRLKLPKPFSTIHVHFKCPVQFRSEGQMNLKDAQQVLAKSLPSLEENISKL